MFILSMDSWLVSDVKVYPVPVTSYCLEADAFQRMHLTTNEKTNPIWVLGWQTETKTYLLCLHRHNMTTVGKVT